MKRRICFSATAALAAVLACAPASAAMDETVKGAIALQQQGKAAQAYAMLAPLVATRAGDPDYDYALGLAAADSGRPGEAILAFQRVLSVQPGNSQARAELARAYALGGDVDTAHAQFNTVVQDPTLPDPVRQRFDSIVRRFDREIAGGGTDLSGFIDASAGHDSNINSATNLTTISIPLFAGLGPGTLGGAARRIDKQYYDLQGGISVATPASRQMRVFGSLLGTWRDNIGDRTFDQASLTGTAGASYSLASRDVMSLSGQVQKFWLGHDGYRNAYGAIGQYTHLMGNGAALSVGAQLYRFDYDNDPLRDADRYALALSYADRILVASVSGGKEEARRNAGDQFSNGFVNANLGFEQAIAPGLNVVGGISGELRRYDDADPLFLKKRKDEQIDASIGLKYLLTRSVYLRPRVTYTRNFSNIALYDFKRWTASLGVRFEFRGN
ncbi:MULTISPECIES: surface lipoprotein assembly modifier [unclassified Sphingomonas]|uniref:surface lipoprotein assembly modifier n=1 Tax=unclassified Sphingomonas TaxID=196159 RepID=UPI000ACBC1A1|nr:MULTISPECIES: tetratricopeptide repeat protein [unclassified Sphingomonas]